ncbi:glycoside hydrolase family 78 protein [Cercospora zeae-maydis SCOH1-5]|uniref:Glycoside hydrolase family 78 protein n=1 Tax=Cercospora zeae-maydis SCOH1-5 TaxID=717836 RepID=A0A6A6F205_9PEZI|nr:glycoside hydrolase family 78 protein [Cercospora zeae-maydis SCOH1-5]
MAVRLLAVVVLPVLVAGFVDYGDVVPVRYSLDTKPSLDPGLEYTGQSIELSGEKPVLTIDYGAEVAGFPFFDVETLSAPTQVEVKYAEDFTAFDNPYSDGPWTFSNGLSSSFRTETFELSAPGRQQAYLLQGGQRWQTIRLLTNTTVTFQSVGLNLTSENEPSSAFVGQLHTSNELYDKIWDLGPRVVQAACVDAGNAPSTWEITPDGALIRGQQTAQSNNGSAFANYTLSFQTKIVRGGTGWRVGSTIGTPQGHILYLTSNYPENTTFVNTNRTLVPANTLVYNYGYSIVNQSTLTTGWNQWFPVNQTIAEDEWYTITTTLSHTSINVSLDGNLIATIPQDEAIIRSSQQPSYLGALDPTSGTFGLGPWADQIAYYKDILITSSNGTKLYTNPLTSPSPSALSEFNTAPLTHNVCLDGAKRDRLVWAGDFYHTTKILASSTARWDYILGTINFILDRQRPPNAAQSAGLVPISANLGTSSAEQYVERFPDTSYGGLLDYQDLFLASVGHYFLATGDAEGLRTRWEGIKSVYNARKTFIDPYSGLMAGVAASYFLGPVNGSAPTGLAAYAYQTLIPLAAAMEDAETVRDLNQTSQKLMASLNAQLWNASTGVWDLSITDRGNFSFTGIAWAILSGAANSSQAAASIARIPELRVGVGYKTSSADASSDTTQLSPNTGGFLLEALFKAERDLGVKKLSIAKSLLDDFWSQMVNQNEYFSGASWEYVFPDGKPGIDLFTSLAHPWGAAPTYVLPQYLVGVTALEPGFKSWAFEPMIGALGLSEANATTWTPAGPIAAEWKIVGEEAIVTASAPEGISGVLRLPDGAGKKEFQIPGGKHFQISWKNWS